MKQKGTSGLKKNWQNLRNKVSLLKNILLAKVTLDQKKVRTSSITTKKMTFQKVQVTMMMQTMTMKKMMLKVMITILKNAHANENALAYSSLRFVMND